MRPSNPGLLIGLVLCAVSAGLAQAVPAEPERVQFRSGDRTLGGELYRPAGTGPFPALLYNHGSAPGMLNSQAAAELGPRFARQGWIFFMPYRRGQGLSATAGSYIGDEIAAARRRDGPAAAAQTMTRLLSTEQLDDQLAALDWLRARSDVVPTRVAAGGNSFGGIEALLGAAAAPGRYCAVAAASAASESWSAAPVLQERLLQAARDIADPVMLFQARNDHDLAPNVALQHALQQRGTTVLTQVYPPHGRSAADGHAFAWRGAAVWLPDVLGFLDRHCR